MRTFQVLKELDHCPLPTRQFEARPFKTPTITEDKLVYSDGVKIPAEVISIWLAKKGLVEIDPALQAGEK
jgi:hypothetical protein